MKLHFKFLAAFVAVALGWSLLAAQDIQLTPLERKNQDVASKEIRDMNQYYHFYLAPQFIAPGYIQHNPNVPSGLDGYMKYMNRIPGRTPDPLPADESVWKVKPVLILTSGDMVLFLFDRQAPDEANPGKTITFNAVDLLRVEDGLVQEHWDGVRKGQGPTGLLTPTQPAPKP